MLLLEAIQHHGVRMVAAGWSAFIVENVVVTQNRDWIINALGDEKMYISVYGTLSTTCLSATVYSYLRYARRSGPAAFTGSLPPTRAAAALALQSLGLVGISQMMPPLGEKLPVLRQLPVPPMPVVQVTVPVPQVAAPEPMPVKEDISGCPVPRMLRIGRERPANHPPQPSAVTSATAAAAQETSPSEALAPAGSAADRCPVTKVWRFLVVKPIKAIAPFVIKPIGAVVGLFRGGSTLQAQQALPASPAPAESSVTPAVPPKADLGGCPVPKWLRGSSKPKGHDVEVASRQAAAAAVAPEPVPAVSEADLVSGPERVTRHVCFWALGFYGLGAAIAAPHAGCAVMFSGPAAVAAIGGAHQDYRYRISGKLSPEKDAATSGLPFLALLEGRQSWATLYEDMDKPNAAAATLLACLLAGRRALRPF
eukprot:gnl/TRDRNA2_/TRDRNA2_125676_c0_seq1.p1 gnl/TRDRNA2_/TRDRNA2_125676_c0~~gnl/TRDRNA2_/TRDRNA2_125676_c0_seq1.p1  ORF type:complete len:424 (+),score=89.36 gnl/TRDRNA2_/TRDRNA2_125676_c0_seq1:94-1365(+)